MQSANHLPEKFYIHLHPEKDFILTNTRQNFFQNFSNSAK